MSIKFKRSAIAELMEGARQNILGKNYRDKITDPATRAILDKYESQLIDQLPNIEDDRKEQDDA